ncbi:hypothetical protein DL98DRAFT_540430 [Cadophora sp. DSE1049]|nr:hypothetical protein DL98DRAFT_540430 [Cadophora sp. DSE1049]
MQHDSSSDNGGDRTRRLILKAASLCRLTYGLDAEDMETALNSDDDVANFVESAVLIRDNTSDPFTSLTDELQRCILHGWKVAQSLEDRLHSLIQDRSEGMDQAVERIWSGVVMSRQWSFMPGNDRSWAFNETLGTLHTVLQSVYFNIISGELLVDGRPLGRIPRSFAKDPLYQRLFGSRIVRVFASDMPGMWYMTARPVQQYHVHMGMVDDQLLIRVRDGDDVLEVVPHKKFEGDLPFHFRENFTQRLNLQNGVVELRPLSDRWSSSIENWRLLFSLTSTSFMNQVRGQLVDVRSQSRNKIVEILLRLDDGDNIHIMLLRDKASDRRSVLLPYGSVSVKKHQMHVGVTIDTSCGTRIRYFRYILDPHLRKLRGPHDILSELYLCYLHALSSFPLPNNFTGRTGTEQALMILRRESLRGFSPLDQQTRNLLSKISQLTPKREFYPSHLQVMQRVSWNMNLDQLSQHDEFNVAVKDIISHTNQFKMLYGEANTVPSSKDQSSVHLMIRASQRHSTSRSYEFGGDIIDPALDEVYVARDCQADNQRCFGDLIDLSFPKTWGSLYNLCRSSQRERDLYNLMFLFCPIAFGQEDSPMIIRTLLSFAFSNKFEEMPAPQYPTFNLNDDAPVHSSLEQALRSCCQQFVKRPSGFTKGSTQDVKWRNDLRSAYDKDLSSQIKLCRDSLVSQWPCRSPPLPPKNLIALINRDSALHKCDGLFAEWYKNYQFKPHIKEVQGILAGMWCQENRLHRQENRIIEAQSEFLQKKPPGLSSLFGTFEAPILGDCPPPLTCKRFSVPNAYHGDYEDLDSIISDVELSPGSIQQEYGTNLRESFKSLRNDSTMEIPLGFPFELGVLTSYRAHLRQNVNNALAIITTSLRPRSKDLEILKPARL